jgi:hypothetical protein
MMDRNNLIISAKAVAMAMAAGAASAALDVLTADVMPDLQHIAKSALAGAIVGFLAYLKQSPLGKKP